MKKRPEPPAHLSQRAQNIWRDLVKTRADSTERQVLLRSALEDLDRIDELRELLAREGLMSKSERSGLTHVHAAVRLEAEARRRFLAAWRALGLIWPADAGFPI